MTWLISTCRGHLRLTRPLADDLRLPSERPAPPGAAYPRSRVLAVLAAPHTSSRARISYSWFERDISAAMIKARQALSEAGRLR